MDWQIRIALIIGGIVLVGYIYFDFTKKRKTQKDNDRLKKRFKEVTEQIDGAGFDSNGVGTARPASLPQEQVAKGTSIDHFISSHRKEPVFEQHDSTNDVVVEKEILENQTPDIKLTEQAPEPKPEQTKQPQRALVLSLILQAPQGHKYLGKDFLPIFLSQGLRHGDMGIFHRRQRAGSDPGSVLFSLANGIAPGIFDLQNLEAFETPALALFTTLPGPDDPQVAYDAMVKTARLLKTEIGGEILDETKSAYTEQTHNYRLDQIQTFSRTLL